MTCSSAFASFLSRFCLSSRFSVLESQSTSAATSSGWPFFSSFESKKPSRYPLTIRSSKSDVEIAGVRRVGTNRTDRQLVSDL